MSKVLGLEIGSNAIGWAIVDTSANQPLHYGAFIVLTARSVNYVRELIKRICRHYNIISNSITVNHILPKYLKDAPLNRQRSPKRVIQIWFNLAITELLKWITTKK